MFQLVCDLSGVVVETALTELVPAVLKWGNKLDHVLRVLLSHITNSALVFVWLCNVIPPLFLSISFLISTIFLKWKSLPQSAALPTSFWGWRICWVKSSCLGWKRTLEYRYSFENADRIACFGAQESNWDMPLFIHSRNEPSCAVYCFAWIVC